MGYLTISTKSDAIKNITDDIFLSGSAHALCVQHSPTAAALSTSFLLNHAPPNSPELNALIIQDLVSHAVVWVWVVSQKDWRNQRATTWILAMHWYSIWVKKMRILFPSFAGSAETQVIWGGTVGPLLIAYFIGNISATKYQNAFTYVRVMANQRWDVFWDTV